MNNKNYHVYIFNVLFKEIPRWTHDTSPKPLTISPILNPKYITSHVNPICGSKDDIEGRRGQGDLCCKFVDRLPCSCCCAPSPRMPYVAYTCMTCHSLGYCDTLIPYMQFFVATRRSLCGRAERLLQTMHKAQTNSPQEWYACFTNGSREKLMLSKSSGVENYTTTRPRLSTRLFMEDR